MAKLKPDAINKMNEGLANIAKQAGLVLPDAGKLAEKRYLHLPLTHDDIRAILTNPVFLDEVPYGLSRPAARSNDKYNDLSKLFDEAYTDPMAYLGQLYVSTRMDPQCSWNSGDVDWIELENNKSPLLPIKNYINRDQAVRTWSDVMQKYLQETYDGIPLNKNYYKNFYVDPEGNAKARLCFETTRNGGEYNNFKPVTSKKCFDIDPRFTPPAFPTKEGVERSLRNKRGPSHNTTGQWGLVDWDSVSFKGSKQKTENDKFFEGSKPYSNVVNFGNNDEKFPKSFAHGLNEYQGGDWNAKLELPGIDSRTAKYSPMEINEGVPDLTKYPKRRLRVSSGDREINHPKTVYDENGNEVYNPAGVVGGKSRDLYRMAKASKPTAVFGKRTPTGKSVWYEFAKQEADRKRAAKVDSAATELKKKQEELIKLQKLIEQLEEEKNKALQNANKYGRRIIEGVDD